MNRVKIAFIALFCAAFLAACGDTGDPRKLADRKTLVGPHQHAYDQPDDRPNRLPDELHADSDPGRHPGNLKQDFDRPSGGLGAKRVKCRSLPVANYALR